MGDLEHVGVREMPRVVHKSELHQPVDDTFGHVPLTSNPQEPTPAEFSLAEGDRPQAYHHFFELGGQIRLRSLKNKGGRIELAILFPQKLGDFVIELLWIKKLEFPQALISDEFLLLERTTPAYRIPCR